MEGRDDKTRAKSLACAASARLAFARGGTQGWPAVRILIVTLCLLLSVALASSFQPAPGKTGASGELQGALLALEDGTTALAFIGGLLDGFFDPSEPNAAGGLPLSGDQKAKDASETDGAGKSLGFAAPPGYHGYPAETHLLTPRAAFFGKASEDDHPPRLLRGPPPAA